MDLRGKKIEEGYFNLVTVEGDANATSGKLQDGQGSDLGNVSVGGLSFNNTNSELKLPTGTTAQRPATPQAGYVRWNTTEGRLEVYDGSYWAYPSLTQDLPFGTAWATTSALTSTNNGHIGVGTTSSSLSIGGFTGSTITRTEKWNGTSWATTSSLNTARSSPMAFGTTENAIATSGYDNITSSEIWSGSSWATTTSLPAYTFDGRGTGVYNDGIVFGGNNGSSILTTNYKWNGSSWATTSALNTARTIPSGFGDSSSSIASEGQTTGSTFINTTEKWNGSSWATTSASTTSANAMGCSLSGSFGISFAGTTGSIISTSRIWNDSVWTTTSNLPAPRALIAGTGTSKNALGFGGYTGGTVFSNTYLWS